jgi:hypothetical protein
MLDTFPSVLVRERILMKSDLFRFIRVEGHLVPWRSASRSF